MLDGLILCMILRTMKLFFGGGGAYLSHATKVLTSYLDVDQVYRRLSLKYKFTSLKLLYDVSFKTFKLVNIYKGYSWSCIRVTSQVPDYPSYHLEINISLKLNTLPLRCAVFLTHKERKYH